MSYVNLRANMSYICGFCACNVGFVLVLPEALVQMDDLASSLSVIQYYTTIQHSMRGRNVYLQYLSHQELNTDPSSHAQNRDQFCILQGHPGKCMVLDDEALYDHLFEDSQADHSQL